MNDNILGLFWNEIVEGKEIKFFSIIINKNFLFVLKFLEGRFLDLREKEDGGVILLGESEYNKMMRVKEKDSEENLKRKL